MDKLSIGSHNSQIDEIKSSDTEVLRGPNMMQLPTELHLLISSHLTYPDALSLKHTNQHFNKLVYTGVNLKIEWLIERRRLHLDCPHDKGCELGSDMRFCRGSVRLLMKRRREHGECETQPGGRGCLVFGTAICAYRQGQMGLKATTKRWARKLFVESNVILWILLAMAGVALASVWMEMKRLEQGART